MMINVIFESRPTARKVYGCDACDWLMDALGCREFTIGEYRAIVRARREGWKIRPGRRYVRQFNKSGADTWTFRAIPEIHEICVRHELYSDWY